MNKGYLKLSMGFWVGAMISPAYAGLSIGDPESELGALTLSATFRANYQDKDYGVPVSDQKIKFDTAIVKLDYQSQDWFGKAEYRCYQYDTLCDFSTLVDGYVGYKLNSTDHVTLGLQPIPFGPGTFWDSSFYAGINNTMGLQDAHNLGVNYHVELPSKTKVDLAYFATDGGNYVGNSRDAARYTANLVHSADPAKTDLNEKNMWMARVKQELTFLKNPDLKVSVGGSYWYSDIENNRNAQNGSRKAWALFNQVHYKNFAMTLTGGSLAINNQDPLNPYSSTLGSFETEYDIANKGHFYSVDTSYSFKNVRDGLNVSPYVVFSGFEKKQKGFNDSIRNIVGVLFDYKDISVYSEYVMSKSDPFVGGSGNALASGDDAKWKKLLNFTFIYRF